MAEHIKIEVLACHHTTQQVREALFTMASKQQVQAPGCLTVSRTRSTIETLLGVGLLLLNAAAHRAEDVAVMPPVTVGECVLPEQHANGRAGL